MAVEAQNLVEQFVAEAVHHGHDDDQGGDSEHDAKEGEPGDDRDESLLPPRAQVAQRQHPFERRKRPRPLGFGHFLIGPRQIVDFHTILAETSRCAGKVLGGAQVSLLRHSGARRNDYWASKSTAASMLISSREPSARFFTSTLPSARLRGPTITCHGRPIRSAVANLRARPLVAVVVEHLDPFGGEIAIDLLAGGIGFAPRPA